MMNAAAAGQRSGDEWASEDDIPQPAPHGESAAPDPSPWQGAADASPGMTEGDEVQRADQGWSFRLVLWLSGGFVGILLAMVLAVSLLPGPRAPGVAASTSRATPADHQVSTPPPLALPPASSPLSPVEAEAAAAMPSLSFAPVPAPAGAAPYDKEVAEKPVGQSLAANPGASPPLWGGATSAPPIQPGVLPDLRMQERMQRLERTVEYLGARVQQWDTVRDLPAAAATAMPSAVPSAVPVVPEDAESMRSGKRLPGYQLLAVVGERAWLRHADGMELSVARGDQLDRYRVLRVVLQGTRGLVQLSGGLSIVADADDARLAGSFRGHAD